MTSPIPNSLSVFHCDPVPIAEFDDSDLLEESSGTVSSLNSPSGLKVKGQHVPIIRQSVLIGSLLEQLCSLYESDKVKSNKLYYLLCDQLSKLGIISPVAYLKEFTSVHTQYKQTLYNIIQSSIMRLDAKPTFPSQHNIPTFFNSGDQESGFKPIIVDPGKVFDFDMSRYHQEFVEKGRVGSGGYGSVFRALSKIDGQEYAMKKITLRDSLVSEENEILLREVRILAGLRHKNIVRYHNAWIEHVEEKHESEPNFSKSEDSSFDSGDFKPFSKQALTHSDSFLLKSSEDEGSNPLAEFGSKPFDLHSKNGLQSGENQKRSPSKFWGESSASETSVVREKTKKITFSISPENSEEENELVFQNSQSGKNGTKFGPESPPKDIIYTHGVRRDMDNLHRVRSFIITKDTNPAKYGEFIKAARNRSFSAVENYHSSEKKDAVAIATTKKSKSFPQTSFFKNKLVLYIQMELCQTSLKHWLSVRNKNIIQRKETFHEGTSLFIMKQITSALLFIHSKDLIHRDVKPPNIFLNGLERPHVLLGDFGLAKSDFRTMNSETASAAYHRPRSLRRVDSHTSGVGTTTYAAPEQLTAETYDTKVDIYSFGIVVYELWTPFGTAMERARQVKQLREHVIPSEFILKHAQVGKLVSSLLDHDPKLRPSADEIFQGDFFEKSKDKIIEEQTERIQILEKENKELKLLNKKLQRLLNAKLPPA